MVAWSKVERKRLRSRSTRSWGTVMRLMEMTQTWTCYSSYLGDCGVLHRSPEAASAHADKQNDLHTTACKRGWHLGDPRYYCAGCSGAYLDFTAVDQHGNPVDDRR
jgi:hypothetical protein